MSRLRSSSVKRRFRLQKTDELFIVHRLYRLFLHYFMKLVIDARAERVLPVVVLHKTTESSQANLMVVRYSPKHLV